MLNSKEERKEMTKEEEKINRLEEKIKELDGKNNKLENTKGRLGLTIVLLFIGMRIIIISDNKEKRCENILSTVKSNIESSSEFNNLMNDEFESFINNRRRTNGINCYSNG